MTLPGTPWFVVNARTVYPSTTPRSPPEIKVKTERSSDVMSLLLPSSKKSLTVIVDDRGLL